MSGEKEKRAKELLWDKESNPKKQSVRGVLDRVQCPGSPIMWLPARERKLVSPGLPCNHQKLKILRTEKNQTKEEISMVLSSFVLFFLVNLTRILLCSI